jgi:hypothetical protein
MKLIVSIMLLLSVVGCATSQHRGPASGPNTTIEKQEKLFDKHDSWTGP